MEPAVTHLQVGEVVRIRDVAPGGGSHEVRVPGEFGGSVREALHLGDAGEHVEHAREHVHRPGGVLADHVEHGVAQAFVIGHRHDQGHPAVPDHGTGGQMARRHSA